MITTERLNAPQNSGRESGPPPTGRNIPLQLRLLIVLGSVVVVGVIVVFLLAGRAIDQNFRRLNIELGTAHAKTVDDILVRYYVQNGGWDGVEDLMASEQMTMSGFHELVLTDAAGRVIAAPEGSLRGRLITQRERSAGLELKANGETVGVLLAGTALDLIGPSQRTFLSTVTRAILGAGLTAMLVALLLGMLFLRQITYPLQKLAEAAAGVADGERQQRVQWAANDELGRLVAAFNRMSERLDRSEELRRNMIADIAHELRNPLAVVKADLQALVDGVFPLTADRITSIQEEALLLERLVEDLRTVSLADAGELSLYRESTDVTGLVRQVAEHSLPDLQAKNIRLRLDLPEQRLTVSLDPHRIRQVLLNLLSNAGKFTPPGGEVSVEVRENRDMVETSVADTGPGIPDEEIDGVFQRFRRGGRKGPGGTGLGLAVARRLVELHGGRLVAGNRPGGGARFTFTLPIDER